MEVRFPDLNCIPYSRRASVPWRSPQFIRITRENPAIYHFVVSNLTDDLHPHLAEIFDRERLAATMPPLFRDQRLPPLRSDWLARVPGMWRFSSDRHDKFSAVRGALQLLALDLYLKG
jgi:hypothetical protein